MINILYSVTHSTGFDKIEEQLHCCKICPTTFITTKMCSRQGLTMYLFPGRAEISGRRLGAAGIHTRTEKNDAIRAAPAPTKKQQLCSLLGAINYYGKFSPTANNHDTPPVQTAPWGLDLVVNSGLPERFRRHQERLGVQRSPGPLRFEDAAAASLWHVTVLGRCCALARFLWWHAVADACRTFSDAE